MKVLNQLADLNSQQLQALYEQAQAEASIVLNNLADKTRFLTK